MENLKLIASFGWLFLTRLKSNRMVNLDGKENVPIGSVDIKMTEEERAKLAKWGLWIEVYHRALKQCCWAERAQVRKAVAILEHLLLSLRAFLRSEAYRLQTGVSWYEAKAAIIREATRAYLAQLTYELIPTA